jgi:riboflavin biosynthesis pyrimidine reductase
LYLKERYLLPQTEKEERMNENETNAVETVETAPVAPETAPVVEVLVAEPVIVDVPKETTAAPVLVNKVGRPKGKVRKVSDAQRIRNVLDANGIATPSKKVKSLLCRCGGDLARRFRNDKALDVKIAQVRSKMIAEKTGVARKGPGRRTKEETALLQLALAKVA